MDRYGDLFRPAALVGGGFYGGSAYKGTLPYEEEYIGSTAGKAYTLRYGAPDLLLPLPYSSVRERSPMRRPWPRQTGTRAKHTASLTTRLGPRKKPLKKTRNSAPPAASQSPMKKLFQQKKSSSSQKVTGKPTPEGKPSAATLAEETRELHRLFRTGVEGANGKKIKNSHVNDVNGGSLGGRVDKAGQKRKAAVAQNKGPSAKKKQKDKAVAQKKHDEPSSAKKKKQKKGTNNKPTKGESGTPGASTRKQPSSTAKQPSLTEEEVRAVLELQTAACNSVREFLGICEAKEGDIGEATKDVEITEGMETAKIDVNPVEAAPHEDEKVLQERGYKFFTKLFQDNQDFRKMYLHRKDAGAFECLVCSSASSESSKKFTNLTSLLMHTSMRKKNQPEHLGYGQAVCDILGWESLRGPKRSVKQEKENVGEPTNNQPENLDENAETVLKNNQGEITETAKPPGEKAKDVHTETTKLPEEERGEAVEAPEEGAVVEEPAKNEGAN